MCGLSSKLRPSNSDTMLKDRIYQFDYKTQVIYKGLRSLLLGSKIPPTA
jgi:hypothetical protein